MLARCLSQQQYALQHGKWEFHALHQKQFMTAFLLAVGFRMEGWPKWLGLPVITDNYPLNGFPTHGNQHPQVCEQPTKQVGTNPEDNLWTLPKNNPENLHRTPTTDGVCKCIVISSSGGNIPVKHVLFFFFRGNRLIWLDLFWAPESSTLNQLRWAGRPSLDSVGNGFLCVGHDQF